MKRGTEGVHQELKDILKNASKNFDSLRQWSGERKRCQRMKLCWCVRIFVSCFDHVYILPSTFKVSLAYNSFAMLNSPAGSSWLRASQLEVLVTRACDPSLPEPNYALHIEVADHINTKKANTSVALLSIGNRR